jgi:hypothetical protein
MATIRVKRGTAKPSTSALSYVGELAFDYSKNALYARNSTEVVKIGGELEKVFYYEGSTYFYALSYSFSNEYFYRIKIVATTNGNTVDTSNTILYYRNASQANLAGSHLSIIADDVNASITRSSVRNTTTFTIPDAYANGVTLTSGVTKVIEFELSPTYATNLTSTNQWVAVGTAATTCSGQGNASITMVKFVHSINGVLGGLFINPGLDAGSPDMIGVTIYRTLRK